MKRKRAAALAAVLAVGSLWLARPRQAPSLIGRWEAAAEMAGGEGAAVQVFVRYIFEEDGTYTCVMARERSELDRGVRVRGKYAVREDRLCLSQGMDYEPSADVYDLYTLEGDVLTLLGGPDDAGGGIYPLALARVPEN